MTRKQVIAVPLDSGGLFYAPPESIPKLKEAMANEKFRILLVKDPQKALKQVGILVDDQTAAAIQTHLAGKPEVKQNALITVGTIA